MVTKEEILNNVKTITDKVADPEYKPVFTILMVEKADEELIYHQSTTAGEKKDVRSGFPDTGDTFDVGFYHNVDDAIEALASNCCDIQEGIYQAGFILCRFPGVYPVVSSGMRMYFRWNAEEGKFVQAEEPSIFAHIAF